MEQIKTIGEGNIPQGLKAHLYFEAFCGTTEVVP
jgi:hypothetical protein